MENKTMQQNASCTKTKTGTRQWESIHDNIICRLKKYKLKSNLKEKKIQNPIRLCV